MKFWLVSGVEFVLDQSQGSYTFYKKRKTASVTGYEIASLILIRQTKKKHDNEK